MRKKTKPSYAAAQNQSKTMGTTNHLEIADLPDEITEDILLRLPVKSLLKFKCVSKSWLSLISSPRFVETHLQVVNRCADLTKHGFIFRSYENGVKLKQCSISSLMSKSRRLLGSDVDYPNKHRDGYVTIVGSCNGITCIKTYSNRIFLWNPSTRKSKALPLDDKIREADCLMWGFGFIESDDDYKVVGLFRSMQESITMIYSLRTNSWKRYESYRHVAPVETTGLFGGGKIYFTAYARLASEGMPFSLIIRSVDLKTGAYGILREPDPEEGRCEASFKLGILGGCLSIFWCNERGTRSTVDVWVMKKYSVDQEVWTKVVSIPYFRDFSTMMFSKPLLIMPNGEIVLWSAEVIIFYNPRDGSFKYSRICNFNIYSDVQAQVYVESLVSI